MTGTPQATHSRLANQHRDRRPEKVAKLRGIASGKCLTRALRGCGHAGLPCRERHGCQSFQPVLSANVFLPDHRSPGMQACITPIMPRKAAHWRTADAIRRCGPASLPLRGQSPQNQHRSLRGVPFPAKADGARPMSIGRCGPAAFLMRYWPRGHAPLPGD